MARHTATVSLARSNRFWVAAVAALIALFAGLLVGQPFTAAPAHATSATTGTGGLFQPDQVRLFDSRSATYGTPAQLQAGTWKQFAVQGAQGLPPSGISAVQVTFTVLNQSGAGDLYADKGGTSTPSTAVPYVVYDSSTTSNTAVLPVGSNGGIQVKVSTTADLLIDVQGYYTNGNTDDGGYVPTSATQIFNSGSTKYAAGSSVTFTAGGTSPIPTNASGVMLDIIEANGGTSAGFLTAYPAGTTKPSNSLNWPAGHNYEWTTAVDLTKTTGSNAGKVTITIGAGSGSVNLSVGVEGYYTATTGTTDSGQFTPGNARVLNNTTIGAGATQTIQIGGSRGVPMAGSGITAAALNLEIYPGSGATGNITAYASNGSGGQSAQQYYSGDSTSAFDVVKLGPDGAIKVTNNSSGSIVIYVDTEGWFTSVGAAIPSGQTTATTQQNLTLQGTEASGGSWVTYKYRNGVVAPVSGGDGFVNVPVADVSPAPGSGAPAVSSWPVQEKSSSPITFYPYTWNVNNSLYSADPNGALIQVEACFGTSSTDSNPVCSMPTNVNYEPTAFGASADTTDIGPGTLSTLTGDFEVSATDAFAASSLDSLSIGRTLTTLATPQPSTASASSTNVFGPGWSADQTGPDTGDATLKLTDEAAQGYELFTDTDGSTDTYEATTSLSTYPITFTGVGDSDGDGSTVTKTSATQVTMADSDGTVTTWTEANSAWAVSSVAEAGSNTTSSFTISGSGLVSRILGPVPAGVSCTDSTADSTPGCRSLKLTYETLTVGGTSVTRLASVATSLPQTAGVNNVTTVAAYDYTAGGLLADAYDPRITPNLKTSYTYNSSNRLATVTPPGEAAWTLNYDSSNRVTSVTRPDPSGSTATTTVIYGVPLTGTGLPSMAVDTTSSNPVGPQTWDETTDLPVTGTAVFTPDHTPSGTTASTLSSSDWPYAYIDYLDVNGRQVNEAEYGASAWQIDTTQFDSNGDDVWDLTAGNRVQALTPTTSTDTYVAGQSSSAIRANLLASSSVYNSLNLSEVTDTFGPTHPITLSTGAVIDGQDHTNTIYDEGAPATTDGSSYALPTTVTSDAINARDGSETGYPDAKITHLGYAAVGSMTTTGWALRKATTSTVQMAANPSSADLTTTTLYNAAGQTIENRLPAGSAGGTAQDTDVTYFGATGTGSCANPANAGLVCSTGPAAQPSTGNPLPVTTYAYDADGNVLSVVDTAGTTVRTTTDTYDAGERQLTSAITVTPTAAGGTALPAVTYGYDTSTGLPTTTSTGSGMTLQSDTTAYNNVGEVTSYTDSTGNVSTTSYDLDGRPISVGDGKGTTTYTYDSSSEHRGLVTSENLNVAGMPSTFTASYDPSGAMTTETYPNGLTATSTFNNAGAATGLQYAMGGSTWMSFGESRGIAGQIVAQSSPLSSQNFTYDQDDRLTTVQDSVPSGQSANCTTRAYGFDADSNRTSLTTYNPSSTGACSTASGSTVASSTYDQADRITNTGYVYDTLGRTTTVPAADANGVGQYSSDTGNLSVGYYSNDMVNTETQGAGTLSYGLDPEQDRISTTVNGSTTATNHYSDSSDSPTWNSTSSSAWTRSLDGIDGTYSASEDQTGAVTLELENMHGDIVATALDATTDTGIQTGSYSESTEYGIDRNAASGSNSYGWLGSKQRSANSLSGLITMGVRLYNPNTGRFLSTDPIYGGNANPYVYPLDPVNASDGTGKDEEEEDEGDIGAGLGGGESQGEQAKKAYAEGQAEEERANQARAEEAREQKEELADEEEEEEERHEEAEARSHEQRVRSINQMQQEVKRGQAPRDVQRVDKGDTPAEQPHVHLKSGGAINIDGTWKDSEGQLSNKIIKWLKSYGWNV